MTEDELAQIVTDLESGWDTCISFEGFIPFAGEEGRYAMLFYDTRNEERAVVASLREWEARKEDPYGVDGSLDEEPNEKEEVSIN